MIRLNAGNVLLKPSHRKQLLAWLRRAARLGRRLGRYAIWIDLHRSGRLIQMTAGVSTDHGVAAFRAREHDWRDAAHDIVRRLTTHLHDVMLQQMPARLAH